MKKCASRKKFALEGALSHKEGSNHFLLLREAKASVSLISNSIRPIEKHRIISRTCSWWAIVCIAGPNTIFRKDHWMVKARGKRNAPSLCRKNCSNHCTCWGNHFHRCLIWRITRPGSSAILPGGKDHSDLIPFFRGSTTKSAHFFPVISCLSLVARTPTEKCGYPYREKIYK